MNINKLKVDMKEDNSWTNKYWDIRMWMGRTDMGCWYSLHIEDKYLYPMRCWFNPRHKKLRKSIPKTWSDSVELVRLVNFAIITEFYEDEFNNDTVDWTCDKAHRDFSLWLKKSYKYIIVTRPELENKLSKSYPKFDDSYVDDKGYWHISKTDKRPYEVRYKKVIYYEKLIKDGDDKVLTELIAYREFMWT